MKHHITLLLVIWFHRGSSDVIKTTQSIRTDTIVRLANDNEPMVIINDPSEFLRPVVADTDVLEPLPFDLIPFDEITIPPEWTQKAVKLTEMETETEMPSKPATSAIPPIPEPTEPHTPISHNLMKTVATIEDQSQAELWLELYEQEAQQVFSTSIGAGWNYFTNMTDNNREELMNSEIQLGEFMEETASKARMFKVDVFRNKTIKRILKKLSVQGMSILPKDMFKKYTMLQAELSKIYETSTICAPNQPPNTNCALRLDPDINHILARSRDFQTSIYLWKTWRDEVGPKMRKPYFEFIELANEGAKLNGFDDIGDMWRKEFETDNFESDVEELYKGLMPFYKSLHAYVRRNLARLYPGYMFKDKSMPAHLLGNMWANSWVNLYDYSTPYPGKFAPSPTVQMQKMNYTVEKMFQIGEEFYKSLGFESLPESFWKNSLFVAPDDRKVVCLPAAVDFRNRKDFRVKMCSSVSAEELVQVHHQLGHIYYYMAYSDQPAALRDGASPAFHDAVGAAIGLAVQTPHNFHSLGLLPDMPDNNEMDINFLYRSALDRVAFLPFGYLVDVWRWKLFSGELNETNANIAWWDMRDEIQGIGSPIPRSEADFDPATTFHVAQHMPYIRYFISYILQFQFLKTLCDAAGHEGLLMKCDITGSKEAGEKLRKMMELGASKPWPDVLEVMTGDRQLNINPLLEYFAPLIDWLNAENKKHDDYLGWDGPGVKFDMPPTPAANKSIVPDMARFLAEGSMSSGKVSLYQKCKIDNECINLSVCNGTHCVCAEGFRQWKTTCTPDNAFEVDSVTRGVLNDEKKLSKDDMHLMRQSHSSSVATNLIIVKLFFICYVIFHT